MQTFKDQDTVIALDVAACILEELSERCQTVDFGGLSVFRGDHPKHGKIILTFHASSSDCLISKITS